MDSLINVISLFAISLRTILCCCAFFQMLRAGGFKIITAVDVIPVLNARDLYKFAVPATFLAGYLNPLIINFMSQFAADNKTISVNNPIDLPFGIPRAVSVIVILLHLPVGLWLLYLWKQGFFDLIEQHKELTNNSDTQDR